MCNCIEPKSDALTARHRGACYIKPFDIEKVVVQDTILKLTMNLTKKLGHKYTIIINCILMM